MKPEYLILVVIGAVIFAVSFIFMSPWTYNNYLKNILWVIGIILVALGLYLDNRYKKKLVK